MQDEIKKNHHPASDGEMNKQFDDYQKRGIYDY